MTYGEMYYIQTFKKQTDLLPNEASIKRILSGDYMGSAEFEFGSVQRSWKFLRESNIVFAEAKIPVIGGKGGEANFFVITTTKGLDRFIQRMPAHLDGNRIGRLTKEHSGIWDNAGSSIPVSRYGKVDAWLDVSGTVNRYQDGVPEDSHPILFTTDRQLGLQLFCELKRTKEKKAEDITMFEEVHTFLDIKDVSKVSGILDTDYIVVKKHGKTNQVSPLDIWSKEDYASIITPSIL